jgi:polyisoprenoid-binding protein YceI
VRNFATRVKRNPSLLVGFALWLACLPAQAQLLQLKLDPAKTHVTWTLDATLHNVEGTFEVKSGAVTFDARTGEAHGQIVVDAASGNSGNGIRDSKMKRDVLESGRYPEIVFSPKRVSGFVAGKESSNVSVEGDFTIHGGTHPLTLNLQIAVHGAQVEAQVRFEVPYRSWGMKNPSTLFLKVSDTVQIAITAVGEMQTAHAAN